MMSDGLDAAESTARLARIVLEGEPLTRLNPLLEADRTQAVADLQAEASFLPVRVHRVYPGPYVLHLSVQEGRLVFDIRHLDGQQLHSTVLSLGPFRGLIKDYQMLVESHMLAVTEGREARIQAIDMGRRGLHNEGAQLLLRRLAGKITIDFATARRLFTLVCVLHMRG